MSLLCPERERSHKITNLAGISRALLADVGPWLDQSTQSQFCLRFEDLRIWTRDDPPVFKTFVLNEIQTTLLGSLCSEQGIPTSTPWLLKGLRTDVLKARQQGSSTFWLGIWYQMFYNLEYSQTIILSHRAESTNRLWQTVEGWEQDCRRRFPWMASKPLRYSNRKELTRADTGSSLLIATAGMEDVATSGLITNVHRSESALWKSNAESQIVGILGALPAHGNLIEESTARGYNEHKNRWDAQEHSPTAYFFPFTDAPEYQFPPSSSFERTEEEIALQAVRVLAGVREVYAVADAQVYWRRLKHEEYTKEGKPEATTQEFPLTPREAFRASASNAYYPGDYLEALYEEFKGLEPVEVLEAGANGFGGRIEIYEQPVEGVPYTLGADEAEGYDQDEKHDDSAADMFRDDTREQVLAYTGRPDGEHFAYDLDGLSTYFQNALIICERPPLGGATNNKLKEINANCYRHTLGSDTAPELTKFGFPARAKDLRDSALKALLCRADQVWVKYRGDGMKPSDAAREVHCPVIRSKVTILQLLGYANLKNGKRAGVGIHDDHNTSATVATWYMDNFVPRYAVRSQPKTVQSPVYAAKWSRRG